VSSPAVTEARPASDSCGAREARTYVTVYAFTVLALTAGPITLGVLAAVGASWRAETTTFYAQVAQVLPVLVLALGVERLFSRSRHERGGEGAAVAVFCLVVAATAVAEILALLMLAIPCDGSSCSSSWPAGLAGAATIASAAAIPAALALVIADAAIASGLHFRRHAAATLQVTTTVVRIATASVAVGAVATVAGPAFGLTGIVAAAVSGLLVGARTTTSQEEDDEIAISVLGLRLAASTARDFSDLSGDDSAQQQSARVYAKAQEVRDAMAGERADDTR